MARRCRKTWQGVDIYYVLCILQVKWLGFQVGLSRVCKTISIELITKMLNTPSRRLKSMILFDLQTNSLSKVLYEIKCCLFSAGETAGQNIRRFVRDFSR